VIPISRCSVLTYSSFKRSASLNAISIDCLRRGEIYTCVAPSTCGILLNSLSRSFIMLLLFASSLSSKGLIIPSFCKIRLYRRCSFSIIWFLFASARFWASAMASCALIVSLSQFIFHPIKELAVCHGFTLKNIGVCRWLKAEINIITNLLNAIIHECL